MCEPEGSREEERIARILADVQERRDAGETVDEEEVLLEHPDLAGSLRDYFRLSGRLDELRTFEWPEEDAEVPSRIGKYEIGREIGRGGMGVVYEAIQDSLERKVALKVLHPSLLQSDAAVERFRREARAAGGLRHPNIVPIREMSRAAGVWYIAMELVEGRALNRLLDEWRNAAHEPPSASADLLVDASAPPSWFVRIADKFAGVADALEVAHRSGVIHRDIKPGNLVAADDGLLMVVDFGLARLDEAMSMTVSGSILGTLEYMSPEQARVRGAGVDHRTDIYSLGATLYEMVTLRPPFRGESVPQICAAIADETPMPPRKLNPAVPPDLETIILHAMAKDPCARYASGAELASDLRRFVDGEPIQARRPPLLSRAIRGVARPRVPGWVAVVVVVSVLALAALVVVGRGDGQEKADAAKPSVDEPVAPRSFDELMRDASAHFEASRFADAEAACAKALELRPQDPNARWLRYRSCFKEKRFEEALRAIDAVLEIRQSGKGHRSRYLVLENLGRLDEALVENARACELIRSYVPHVGRVRILLEMRRYEDALRVCKNAATRFPRTQGFQRKEVVALRGLGNPDEARQRAVAHVAGRGRKVSAVRAYLLAVAGREEDARALIPEMDSPFILAAMASVLGDRDLTVRALNDWIQSDDRIPPNAAVEPDLLVWKKDAEIQKLLDEICRPPRAPR